jgi:predicted TIM-barrel fold metal-dependent hydrolase
MTTVFDDVRIIDADSHVAEPTDLWTSRLPSKWADRAPHVEWDEAGGEMRWKVGDMFLSGVGEYAVAGWKEDFPSHPPSLEQADPGAYDPRARLERLDQFGVHAQVLYPNLIGFDSHAFFTQLGPEMATDCVRAYNDFLAEFASVDSKRLIPVMMLPFWDIEASVAEIDRAQALGHKGILFAASFERIGFPNIADGPYDPILAAAEERELSMNFHVGFSIRSEDTSRRGWNMRTKNALAERTNRISFVKRAASGATPIIDAAMDVVLGGLCQKFPNLKFVSVESGFGYWPYVCEISDWYWKTSGAWKEFPDRELPSVYYRRSFYSTILSEQNCAAMLEEWQDNVMFETDFPHGASAVPGTAAELPTPRDLMIATLSGQKPEVIEKILHGNAAKLYHMD